VNFRFINVLQNILEEENLIKDAYIEELKISFNKVAKSVNDVIAIAPELKQYLEEKRSFQNQPQKSSRNIFLSGSILSAAVFVGSTVLYGSNQLGGELGMIGSMVIMLAAVLMREH
jgi:hypothetical protein